MYLYYIIAIPLNAAIIHARMENGDGGEVKSALAIFVKDLVIVHDEAKLLRSPVPLAGAALQQFISGEALGQIYLAGPRWTKSWRETRRGDRATFSR